MQNINAAVQELLDREAIRDCLYRYCRGVDRADEAALRSAYWEDATDRHGPYQGTAAGFIEWALKSLPGSSAAFTRSPMFSSSCSRAGAAVESQFAAYQRAPNAAGVMQQFLLMGRYADWFEKRGEEWRVKRRTVIYDWVKSSLCPPKANRNALACASRSAGKSPTMRSMNCSRWPLSAAPPTHKLCVFDQYRRRFFMYSPHHKRRP